MAFKMRYGRQGPPMYDKSFATKHGHDKGPTRMENQGYPKTIAKPDYPDIDGDGNTTESMKNAAADKAELKNKDKAKSSFTKTPYYKHGAGHKMSSADEKRYNNLLNTLNKMNDPMNSNRGKSIVKELKRIKPGFNPEDHTMGQ
tara:strand:+ start:1484 stop:1915 length:432 start_codon:yes stop_codon:yes gene_type:complete